MSRFATFALRLTLALQLVLALAGCGAATHAGGTTPSAPREIDRIRAEAAARPDDPAAQRALAEWELLGDDGDPDRAEDAVRRASELLPHDVGVAYLRGVLAEQRGRPEEALEAFLAVLRGTAQSDDPLAAFHAESSLAYLRDIRPSTPRFVERARPVLEALAASPTHVGYPTRRQAILWLRDLALERGDVAEVARLDASVGCPTAARVAGPFGLTVLAPFDETLPAEGAGPLAERYDLGPGRGVRETRSVDARHCEVSIGGEPDGGAGTRIVEATIHAPASGRYVLALGSSASVRISIDGRAVGAVDRRRTMAGLVSFHALELEAGDHELELKVSSREGSPAISWTLDHAEGGYDPATGLEPPSDLTTPLARFVVGDVLGLRGRIIDARELLRTTWSERSSAAALSLAARIAATDPHVPDARRADDERRLVALAAARDPRAHWPAWRAALLETDELEALSALREIAARFPQLPRLEIELAGILEEQGYEADADLAITRAASALPDACSVIAARYDALIERARIADATPLAARLVAGDARDEVVYELATGRHDWAAARTEVERLAPLISPERHRVLALRIARASGDAATERRLVAELEAEGEPGEYVLRTADRRYAASDRAGAIRALDEEAARAPRHAGDLRRVTYALSGADVMQAYRVDGREAIRRFEASGRTYEGYAAVLVFDYMVTRIFEDGSAIDLVHQIYRLQTQEGVDRFGTLSLGGRVLAVRAIGADGTVREPNAIGASTEMPPLAVGDFVEYEVVRQHAPQWGDGYVSGGWVFQNFAEPFDHSEMVFVAPIGMDVRFDARGPVPRPAIEDRDGLRAYRFLMEEQRALVREPNALADPPILPSLRAGTRVTWDRMFEAVHDGLLDADREDPAVRRLLQGEILEGRELPPRERVQRIHRWVMDRIEESDDGFYGSAPLMIAARSGSRPRVLRHLLELAGIPARIAFARDLAGERPSADVPDTSVYGAIVVVADVGGAPLHLVCSARGVPHDFLPPGLRGQEAVVLAPGVPRIQLPASQGTAPGMRIGGDLEVDRNGRARMQLTIAFVGAAGAELRTAILDVPQAERARVLAERFVPSLVPGAVADPSSLTVRNLEDWEQDLAIDVTAESDGLVRGNREGIFLVPLFQSGLEGRFARLPRRTTTQLVGETDVSVSLRIRGPGVIHAPEPQSLRGPAGASATLSVSRDGDAVRLERRVHVPLAAIPVAQYDSLAQFCRAAGQLEERTVGFTAR